METVKESDLFPALQRIVNKNRTTLQQVKLDRQAGLNTSKVRNWLSNIGLDYKFVTPQRHGELNAHVERVIQTIRTMARTALLNAQLSTNFWRFALRYAVTLKNIMPHAALQNKTPHELHFQ